MKKLYTFNDFTLDTSLRQLSNNGARINISSKAFDILLYLIENHSKIVLKEELFEAIWTNSFVEENNLPVHISALRRVLGDKRGESHYIKTISGKGYIFVAPIVDRTDELNSKIPIKSINKSVIEISSRSIAVLPFSFEDKSADLKYLANGITQNLIDSLSQITNLKVMAYSAVNNHRTSNLDLSEIGFQLSVDKILTGRLISHNDQIHINVELINVADKSYLWGTQYECEISDLLSIKKKISLIIAEKLKLQFSNNNEITSANFAKIDSEAYKLYLKGKYILDHFQSREEFQDSLTTALNYFQQSLQKDPNFAPAYVGCGRVYFFLFNDSFLSLSEALIKCKTALQLAFNADNNHSDTYTLQGIIQICLEREWKEAEESLLKAIDLNPNNAYAYHYLSFLYTCLNKHDLAITYQNQALLFDPTSLLLNNGLINRFYLSKNFHQAIIVAEESLELNSRSVSAYSLMSLSYAELGMFKEALEFSEKAINLHPLNELYLMNAYIFALSGDINKGYEILGEVLEKSADKRDYDSSNLAAVYSSLNDKDKTFEHLENALTEGSMNVTFLKTDPRFKNTSDDPRFKLFLRKLNLNL